MNNTDRTGPVDEENSIEDESTRLLEGDQHFQHDVEKKQGRFTMIRNIALCFMLSILIVWCYEFLKSKYIPMDINGDDLNDIVTYQVEGVKLMGWKKNIDDNGIDYEEGKYLELHVKCGVELDYNKCNKPLEQVNKLKYLNDRVIRKVCFRLNKFEIWEKGGTGGVLGNILTRDRVCIDLRKEKNLLEFDVLVKPNMREILKVMKRMVFNKEEIFFEDELDIDIYKFGILLSRLKGLEVDINSIIEKKLGHGIPQNVQVEDIVIRGTQDGYFIKYQILIENMIRDIIQKLDNVIKVPKIQMDLFLPNCNGQDKIYLNNVDYSVEEFQINTDEYLNLTNKVQIKGPFPEELMKKKCFEGSVATPLTMIMEKLFKSNETNEISVKGRVEQKDIMIPFHEILKEIGKVQVIENVTINQDEIIKEFNIMDFKIRNRFNRIDMVGKIKILVELKYYEYQGRNEIVVEKVRGPMKIYDMKGVHLMNNNITQWTHVNASNIIKQDSGVYLEMIMDVGSRDIEIINRLATSRFLNKLLFSGSNDVFVEGVIDMQVNNRNGIGEVVLYGLPCANNITIT
ncbi:hypothetical protein TBLA_0A00880 [Henningerozyma blattae CBS 6284]|uniref:Uncharacterized protein n=1 Tax=Henningerozyma blattae (strain ATCC 34711 / CBS 6284 / DSM 70876 / NBRC 10599 / NRRL Y-10934 / UCD 77-7) TaxID=1071380 RepID=I2GUT6_HENB6|nr:hypothetical protein TBLA_0A00880 [Tetrapisispora blattae CBS 6284]CCH57888.1 hypothetical protein TBLA_0A00880 [Tetrapisispora blattae CBS 6284]